MKPMNPTQNSREVTLGLPVQGGETVNAFRQFAFDPTAAMASEAGAFQPTAEAAQAGAEAGSRGAWMRGALSSALEGAKQFAGTVGEQVKAAYETLPPELRQTISTVGREACRGVMEGAFGTSTKERMGKLATVLAAPELGAKTILWDGLRGGLEGAKRGAEQRGIRGEDIDRAVKVGGVVLKFARNEYSDRRAAAAAAARNLAKPAASYEVPTAA
jgi:hypothetical protein